MKKKEKLRYKVKGLSRNLSQKSTHLPNIRNLSLKNSKEKGINYVSSKDLKLMIDQMKT